MKGVGPVLAKKLVEHFGAEVLGVINDNPADLESVDGIGPVSYTHLLAVLPKQAELTQMPRRH